MVVTTTIRRSIRYCAGYNEKELVMTLVNAIVDEEGKLLRLETDKDEVLFVVSHANGELGMVESEAGTCLSTVYDKLQKFVAPKSKTQG